MPQTPAENIASRITILDPVPQPQIEIGDPVEIHIIETEMSKQVKDAPIIRVPNGVDTVDVHLKTIYEKIHAQWSQGVADKVVEHILRYVKIVLDEAKKGVHVGSSDLKVAIPAEFFTSATETKPPASFGLQSMDEVKQIAEIVRNNIDEVQTR
jgi:hypothetical protein